MKPRSEKNSGGNSSDYSETIPRNGNGYQNNESMSEENDRSRSQSPSRKGSGNKFCFVIKSII